MLSTVSDSMNQPPPPCMGHQQTAKQRHPMSPVFRGFSDSIRTQHGEEDFRQSTSKRPGTGKTNASRQSTASNESGSRPGTKSQHRPSTSSSRPTSHSLLLQRPEKEQFTNWSPSSFLSPTVLPLVMTGVEALLETLKKPVDGTYSVQADKVPGSNGLNPVEWLAKVSHRLLYKKRQLTHTHTMGTVLV